MASGLSIHEAKSGRLPEVLPALLPTLRAKEKTRRVSAWGSRLFPHGLPKNARRIFPGQTDLFKNGCLVAQPELASFHPEFAHRAAAFTAANV
ncbi:MAG: hypothetical protein Q8M77_17250 [Hydrogenophaga sp.]|nr:hypothetical protein [Hydrogenophaga sp.]